MKLEPQNEFERRIFRKSRSVMSLRFYRAGKRKFDQFVQYQYHDDLEKLVETIKTGSSDVYKVLDNYSEWLVAQELKAKTVRDYVVAAKKLLRFMDVVILNEQFLDKVTLPTVEEIMDEAPTADQIKMIVMRCNPRLRALVMLMATSGMREGEALKLRIKDFDFKSKPCRVLIPASITKTSRGRETYISEEAVEAINVWLNKWKSRENRSDSITPESLLLDFGDNIYTAEKNAIKMFRTVMEHFPEMNLKVDSDHRVHKIHLYSFRKFFYSKTMPIIGEERAHALMGHGSYMKTYNKRTPEERRADYLKCVDALSIMRPSGTVTREEVDELTTLKGIETALRVMPMKGVPVETLYAGFKSRRGLERDLTISEKIEIADEQLEKLSRDMEFMIGVGEEAVLSDQGNDAVLQDGLRKLKASVEPKNLQKIVREQELPEYIDEGWSFVAVLPSGKIVIKK